MEIVFLNPQYLWAFISIPFLIIIYFLTLKYIKREALEFANFIALARVAKKPIITNNLLSLVLRMLVITTIILAVSGIVIWYEGKSSDSDFVLAIDTSSSMLADDLKPNRLEAAKQAGIAFLDSVSSKTKIGVVSFSGTSFVEQRPTTNLKDVKTQISSINIKPIGGTDIGEAIITSSNLLIDSDKPKNIILLTDGRSNVGVYPDYAIEYANSNHITIHTIGIGTTEGGFFSNLNVSLKLDKDVLVKIANKTSGKYYNITNKEELSNAYKNIAHSEKKKLSINITPSLMLIALILLISEWILANTKFRIIP
jgi:Ca-activated chloride channel family protein